MWICMALARELDANILLRVLQASRAKEEVMTTVRTLLVRDELMTLSTSWS
jgi:hypothetical protein